ncbi:MAG: hypothetical protein NTX48_03905 [Planctomycetales bacterium]|jgi:hypothetical protein|nr:hypothetical protein [Planctomycetales bacterium]
MWVLNWVYHVKMANELGASLNAGGINTQGLYFSIWSRHDYDEFAAAMTG